MSGASLGWWRIIRLSLVQTALGAIVVVTTTTLSRVMVVEMAFPASLPAGLVAWHYAVQLSRPRWGHGSDAGRHRTPWIIAGMALLAAGAILAATATAVLDRSAPLGIALGVVAFTMVGAGVAASGTSLLALLATHVSPTRRPAAAAVAWVMMILGIALTAALAGHVLDPFSPQRLIAVISVVAGSSFLLTCVAVHGVEARLTQARPAQAGPPQTSSFSQALREMGGEKLARQFTIFVFVSMLAYSAQELILEPYAGLVFQYTVGRSTQLAGFQHGGVLVGMAILGLVGVTGHRDKDEFMRRCTAAGCVASAAALAALAAAGFGVIAWPLEATVFILGVANGLFAVSAVGLMMSFAGTSRRSGAGVRIGVWGAAQAAGFGLGGFAGAFDLDLLRHALGPGPLPFAIVFAAEGLLFLVSAAISRRLGRVALPPTPARDMWARSTT